VPDVVAYALAIECGVEELAVRRFQSVQVERQAAGPPAAHLQRREVTVCGRRRPERLGADGLSVDLDMQRATHDRRSLHDRILADGEKALDQITAADRITGTVTADA